MVRTRILLASLALTATALLLLTGCSTGPTWDPEAGSVTSSQLTSRMASVSASSLAEVPVAKARERRDDALAALRKETGGGEVADLLTSAFPTGNVGVPLYVGIGRYAGEKAIIVIEAYGPEGGKLDRKRVWVLSQDGTPLYSSAAR